MNLSVIIPTHNPRPDYLRQVLESLKAQTLPVTEWELVIVDNQSNPALKIELNWHRNGRIVREEKLGLSFARQCGFQNANDDLVVLVDDDNVLAPDYLEQAIKIFGEHPKLGAAGGRSLPEFETRPPDWINEFTGLLACRDLGAECKLASGFNNKLSNEYPLFAPIGAGMAICKTALEAWLQGGNASALSDRQGNELSSGGDNDIVLSILENGWSVGYFPELSLNHLIPATRLQPEYLARLNHGIAKSWMQVLSKHQCNPWPPIPAWTVPIRKMKAWITYRAWAGPAERIRWRGACGHFEGRAKDKC